MDMLYMYMRALAGGSDGMAPHEGRHTMFSYLNPAEEPLCLCGARLDGDHPGQCRKCSDRARWQRRRANAGRRTGPGRKAHGRGKDGRRPA